MTQTERWATKFYVGGERDQRAEHHENEPRPAVAASPQCRFRPADALTISSSVPLEQHFGSEAAGADEDVERRDHCERRTNG